MEKEQVQDQGIEGYRLSPRQMHLWPDQQSSNAYRAQCILRLEGNLDEETLRGALEAVVGRHEILRTTFPRLPGMAVPLQVIGERYSPTLRKIELRGNGVEDSDGLDELFRREGEHRFDFEHGPMLRVALLRVSATSHLLLVTLPALCADVWTLRNLAREIGRAYLGGRQNHESGGEMTQFLKFSEWHHELSEASDESAEAGRAYWNKQRGTPYPLLAFESQPHGETRFAPAAVAVDLESALADGVGWLSESFAFGASAFLLSCWQTLLWRLTAQADIRVDTVFSGRKYPELQEALGLLAGSLPIRVHIEGQMRFTDLLRQSVDAMHAAEEWQEYFSDEDQKTARPSQPVGFSFVDSAPAENVGPITVSTEKEYVCTESYKLRLSVVGGAERLTAALEYEPRVYERETIERIGRELETLVRSVLEAPGASVSELNILPGSDWQKLVVEFNQTRAEYPEHECLHQLFEAQVDREPEALAVIFKNERLSYSDLNARANQLARYLKQKGVGPDRCVGISMERSSAMIVGMLGILKAGAAYVPLDPYYPQERLAYMLHHAAVPVLLTEKRLLERFPQHEAWVVCLDADWPEISRESATNLPNEASPDDLAYVIYTSGSTGKPKGVMIPHRGLVNYLSWCIQAYRVSEGSGSLVHSSIGFDLTVTSLFAPLLVGKSVVLLPEDEGIEALADELRSGKSFSLLKITPSHLDVLTELLSRYQAAGRVNALVIGGEALFGESLTFWRAHASETRIINEYGPTETVVGCCVYEVRDGAALTGAVPIGRPIANTQIYLLDQRLTPVPVGVVGEIYLGGHGLARGYLNAPEQTAEMFIANPFADRGRERLYKTGDLARYLPNGDIEYVGRLDHQVKVRGYRIELGEIEAVLLAHDAVQQCAVLVREDSPGDQRLVAYVTAKSGAKPEPSELRHYLQEKLPDYMVPSAFVALGEMPLTANGKIDRAILPVPEGIRSAGQFRSPETPLERTLAHIWKDLLRVERVGLQDNFFELGGHSLLATQLISRIAQSLNLRVSLRTIFEKPSLEGLALAIVEDLARAELPEEVRQMLADVSGLSEAEARDRLTAEDLDNDRGAATRS